MSWCSCVTLCSCSSQSLTILIPSCWHQLNVCTRVVSTADSTCVQITVARCSFISSNQQWAAYRSSSSLIHDATSLQHHQSDTMVCLLIYSRDHHHSVMLYRQIQLVFISLQVSDIIDLQELSGHLWSILVMYLFSVSISHPHIHISLMSLTVNRTTISSWNSYHFHWLVLLVVSAIPNHIIHKNSLTYQSNPI